MLTLSRIVDPVEKSGTILGFAKVEIDPDTMITFLEQYYGQQKTWAAYHTHEMKSIAFSEKQAATIIAPSKLPNEQIMTTTLTYLAASSPFNPALLPNSNNGFVNVSIGTHPPIVSGVNQNNLQSRPYCQLSLKVDTIPESTARGMLGFGQDFVKVVAKLATLTVKKSWIKNNGGKSWPIRAISDSLLTECQNKKTAITTGAAGVVNLTLLLRQLNTIRNRITINNKRISLSTFNETQLRAYISAVI
jgi:hypothetical protein